MRLKLCHCCGTKIGRKSANNIFFWDNRMRQVAVVFRIPEREIKDEFGNFLLPEIKRTQRLHIPVCVPCTKNPSFEKVKLMMKKDLTLRDVLQRKKHRAVFSHFEIDPVIAGQRIESEEKGGNDVL